MASPDIASRRWIWEQYDQQVGADTVQRPGGDAAVVRVHGTKKALAMTTDCTPRYCYADPYEGGKQAVAEAYRNLCAVGAKPLAITNCLNFGNPQRPEIMAQIVGCLKGMSEACVALDMPIVSGNVSLYNESKATGGGSAILPTPAIGAVGLLEDWEKSATIGLEPECLLVMVGEVRGHLGQSLWTREIFGLTDGLPPPVNLEHERKNAEFVRAAIADGLALACHDISDGGLLVTVAEMALATNIGASIDFEMIAPAEDCRLTALLFGEDQGRFVLSIPRRENEQIIRLSENHQVTIHFIGDTGGSDLNIGDAPGYSGHIANIALDDLRAAHEGFFPALMS